MPAQQIACRVSHSLQQRQLQPGFACSEQRGQASVTKAQTSSASSAPSFILALSIQATRRVQMGAARQAKDNASSWACKLASAGAGQRQSKYKAYNCPKLERAVLPRIRLDATPAASLTVPERFFGVWIAHSDALAGPKAHCPAASSRMQTLPLRQWRCDAPDRALWHSMCHTGATTCQPQPIVKASAEASTDPARRRPGERLCAGAQAGAPIAAVSRSQRLHAWPSNAAACAALPLEFANFTRRSAS